MLKDLSIIWHFRARLVDGVLLDLRQRYAGSVLGVVWAILYPVMLLSVYAFVYTFIFRVRPAQLTVYDYVILVFSGLLPLLSFIEALMASSSSLSANRSLLMNTVFPPELIPLRSILAAQITGFVGVTITLVAAFSLGLGSWIVVLAVPFFWLMLILFVTGLGWILSLVSLVATDIQQGLPPILFLLVIVSPFAYTPDMVPAGLAAILYFNPLTYFVLAFQSAVVYGVWPSIAITAGTIILGCVSFLTGFAFFRRTKLIFFDYA